MSFAKVNIGLRPNGTNQKAHFNLGCDSHFSANFGRYIPIYSQELNAGSHVNLNIRNLVRLSPLTVPTAGRMHVNYYVHYVPFKELYKPFDCLISGQAFPFSSGTSVPATVPSLKLLEIQARAFKSYDYPSYQNYGIFDTCTYASLSSSLTDSVLSFYLSICTNKFFLKCTDKVYFIEYDQQSETFSKTEISPNATPYNQLVWPSNSAYDIRYQYSGSVNYRYVRFGALHNKFNQLMVGLGYPYSNNGTDNTKYSLLPLMAFYYSWFKLFGIERFTNLESTNYYKLKMSFLNHPTTINAVVDPFLADCLNVYYTFAPDYFTSQVYNSADNQEDFSLSYSKKISGLSTADGVIDSDEDSGVLMDDNFQSSVAQSIAKRVLRFINTNTVFGHSVEKYLRSLYPGIQFDKKHDVFKGSYSVPINVDEVWSMADTDNASLGDYAGKAIGGGKSPSFSFDTEQAGLLLVCACVVPKPGYYQSPCGHVYHVNRLDFYNPEFDALGYTPTTRRQFIGETSDYSTQVPPTAVLGLKPRYQEYKWHPNVITGALRQRSYMSTYRGYYLDRFFDSDKVPRLGASYLRILDDSTDIFNLNRIFVDFSPFDDHFLVFNVIDCDVTSHMIPIEDTFVDPDTEKRGTVQVSRS